MQATTPQWVTSQNSAAASQPNADPFVWHNVTTSAALPSMNNITKRHSPWAQFAATCMYFGAELIAARATLGVDMDVPVGLIQSAIGGSQIESWMDNATLTTCKVSPHALFPGNPGLALRGAVHCQIDQH